MSLGGYGLYILFSLPALLLGFWARMKVQSSFKKYSRVRNLNGWTGAQIARKILDQNGLSEVTIEETKGFLSDHYDPRAKVLRLSPEVYRGNSVASAGIAAHESGHAIQDKDEYAPLKIRSAMVPSVQIGSWLGPVIFMVGLIFNSTSVSWVGIGLFAATALFALATLPVEFNASNRAKQILTASGFVYQEEMKGINSVLDSAALTYVAAAVQALSTLLYYVLLLSGRNRD
ncbi:MAG: zinc metallopeptidase [Anaerolineaceae bacterium]